MTASDIPKSRIALFLVLAAIGCALDLATKSWIFNKYGTQAAAGPDPIVLIPGVFGLTTNLNEGALFGVGQGKSLIFAALSIVAAIGVLIWLTVGGAARDRWLTVALALIMAGILGNLYDRLGLHGLKWQWLDPREGQRVYAVRDWLHFQIEAIKFNWPIFNFADSFLDIGAAMLIWHVVWRERRVGVSPPLAEAVRS
jgi:signal peptidase II